MTVEVRNRVNCLISSIALVKKDFHLLSDVLTKLFESYPKMELNDCSSSNELTDPRTFELDSTGSGIG